MLSEEEVRFDTYYWIVVKGPGSESTLDTLEVGLPQLDGDGKIRHWDTCAGKVSPKWVRRILQEIPYPQN